MAPKAKETTTPRNTRKKRRGTSDVDQHVGSRIRLRRTLLGMSQEKLGEQLDLTFQQVQKYERGSNRVSAGRLYDLSNILNVPISFFYDGYDDETANADKAAAQDSPSNRASLELNRAFERIQNPAIRQQFLALAKAVADGQDLLSATDAVEDQRSPKAA